MQNKHSQQEVNAAISRLKHLLQTVPALLQAIPANEFEQKPLPGKWSKKEILGHLADSAANNHHRFVRGQFEDMPLLPYAQNEWVSFNYYQQLEQQHIIELWKIYNTHLVKLLRLVPAEKLERALHKTDGTSHTLAFLIVDYVDHMEHHLKQIIPGQL